MAAPPPPPALAAAQAAAVPLRLRADALTIQVVSSVQSVGICIDDDLEEDAAAFLEHVALYQSNHPGVNVGLNANLGLSNYLANVNRTRGIGVNFDLLFDTAVPPPPA